jgi:hypothetical protein
VAAGPIALAASDIVTLLLYFNLARWQLHHLLREQPFRPFRIYLSNGRSNDIRHPELVMVARTVAVIGKPSPDLPVPAIADYAVVTLLHINDVEPLPASSPPSTNGPTGT